MPTTEHVLYRGQSGRFDLSAVSGLLWFVTAEAGDDDAEADALDVASKYASYGADEPEILRARLSSDAVRGEHEEFANEYAATEGQDWLIELLDEQGADYFVHHEGGSITLALHPDRLHLLVDLSRCIDDDPDAWEAI